MSTAQQRVRHAYDPTDDLVGNGDVCQNCYRLTHESYERNYKRVVVNQNRVEYDAVDGLPPERVVIHDAVEIDNAGLFCRCGSDGTVQYRGKLSMPEVRRYTRHAAKTLNRLGWDLDPEKAVTEAVKLKRDDELGDDDMIMEAVRRACKA